MGHSVWNDVAFQRIQYLFQIVFVNDPHNRESTHNSL